MPEVSGPAAVARAWLQGVSSTTDLAALVRSSKSSPQVYDAVLEVARNTAQPRPNRLGALQAIMAMHNPRLEAEPAWLLAARVGDLIPVSGHSSGPSSAPPSHVTDVPELLARLSWDDRDSTVRHAAQVLRQSLELSNPGHSPLRPGAITLKAGCGGLVTLTNSENITLPLHVSFGVSSQSRELWLMGTANTLTGAATRRPAGHPMHPPAGPVAVMYGGQQVARLTERPNLPCPSK